MKRNSTKCLKYIYLAAVTALIFVFILCFSACNGDKESNIDGVNTSSLDPDPTPEIDTNETAVKPTDNVAPTSAPGTGSADITDDPHEIYLIKSDH